MFLGGKTDVCTKAPAVSGVDYIGHQINKGGPALKVLWAAVQAVLNPPAAVKLSVIQLFEPNTDGEQMRLCPLPAH